MPRVILRPTISSDLSAVVGEPLPYRIRAITAVLTESKEGGGIILGVGGLAFPPGGPPWAFVQQAPEARNYPVAFHRAGLMAMRMIENSTICEVLATCDADNPTALRWLKRLGFHEGPIQKIEGKVVFFWRRDLQR